MSFTNEMTPGKPTFTNPVRASAVGRPRTTFAHQRRGSRSVLDKADVRRGVNPSIIANAFVRVKTTLDEVELASEQVGRPPAVAKTIIVKDFELRARAQRKIPVARQYYIQFTVGATSRSTNSGKETRNRTSWDKVFYLKLNIISDGNDRSVLLVKVYQKHRVGKDKLVGSLTDTVGGILGKLKDGVFVGY
ncbi:hypothetical protein HD554DRAFT_2035274 [Boletus coccyginus]|nr:hypothetical protein HD554DRAFT_2035274 [Boletus coccyginus]